MTMISVILPVYNGKEEHLRQAIESILSQTYTDYEFIIINDGSTDENIEKVILSYNDSRIKYVKQENSGVAQTLNNGLAIAQGKYIARMDADDISLPNRFEKQVQFLETHTEFALCGSWIEVFYKSGKRNITRYLEYPKILDCLRGGIVAHPAVMFNRVEFEKYNLRYNPEYKCEDFELWSRAIVYLNFYNIQEPLLLYRRHENNISFINSAVEDDAVKVRENMLNHLTSNDDYKKKLRKLIERKISLLQQIFSIRNAGAKYKLIIILGIKIKIKKSKFKK